MSNSYATELGIECLMPSTTSKRYDNAKVDFIG
jgi:hypothetical protein